MRLSSQKAVAYETIRNRSKASAALYPAVFLATLAVTPLWTRFEKVTFAIGTWLLAATLIEAWGISRERNPLLVGGRIAQAASIGALAFLSIAGFELSWTTFFVLLVTLSIAALEVPTLAPRFSLSASVVSFLIGPPLLASFLSISGLKGRALALFFSLFLSALIYQARVQRDQYVSALKTVASLRKVADVVQGDFPS